MHGERETSWRPRGTFVAANVLGAALSAWLVVGGGVRWLGEVFGASWTPGNELRGWVLLACAVACAARFVFLVAYLLKRRMDWAESATVCVYLLVIYLVYAILGGRAEAPLDALDAVGGALYVAGVVFNTGGELQRHRFKQRPQNAGRLYTGGFFRIVRHPNYLGDLLWMSGWAVLSRSAWAGLLPLASLLGFVFMHIPALSKHMSEHYGDEFEAYARRTKRLIPGVW